ncbi:hypothetical protein lerEdw1_017352 [Lerista edwardsae]|nr:hypothetical protein lerEdw1_017352 [Lerista edwardsae]
MVVLKRTPDSVSSGTMAQANDENELAILEKKIKEFWTKSKITCCSESIDQRRGLRHLWHNSINNLSELCQTNQSIEEKQQSLSKLLASTEEGEKEKADLMESIQELKEELARKSSTNRKAMEQRVESLNKAEKLFKERLGLEIRKTSANHLQFIFRYIDQKDPDKPYTLTLSINDEGAYEVVSCSPPLDCKEELQRKVRETNNFSAFIANTRKAFIALSYK